MIGTSSARTRAHDAQDEALPKRPRLDGRRATDKALAPSHPLAQFTRLPAEILSDIAMYCAPRDVKALADTHPATRSALAISAAVMQHVQYGHYAHAQRGPLPSLPLCIDALRAAGSLDAHNVESLDGASAVTPRRRWDMRRPYDESLWLEQYDDLRKGPCRVPYASVRWVRFVNLGAGEQLTAFDRSKRRLLRWDLWRKQRTIWDERHLTIAGAFQVALALGSHAAVRLSDDGRQAELDVAQPQRSNLLCVPQPLSTAVMSPVISADGEVLVGQLRTFCGRGWQQAFEQHDGGYASLGERLQADPVRHVHRSRTTGRLLLQCGVDDMQHQLFTLAAGDTAYQKLHLPDDVRTDFTSASLSCANDGIYLTYPSLGGNGTVHHQWVPLRTRRQGDALPARACVMHESRAGYPVRCIEWGDRDVDAITFSDAHGSVRKAVPAIAGYAQGNFLYGSPCATFAVLTYGGAQNAQAAHRGEYAYSEASVPQMLLPVWCKDRVIQFFEPVPTAGLLSVKASVGPHGPTFAAYLPLGRLVVSIRSEDDPRANQFSLRDLSGFKIPRAAGFDFSRDGARLHWLGVEHSTRHHAHYALSTLDLETQGVRAQRFLHSSHSLRLVCGPDAESRDGRRLVAADECGHVLVLRTSDPRDDKPPMPAAGRRRAAP